MIGFPYLTYLAERGHLKRASRVLDVGAQNLLNCTLDDLMQFVSRFRSAPMTAEVEEKVRRLHYFSEPRSGEQTLFASELLDLTDISYTAIDVCPAPKTEIIDLNFARAPSEWRNRFDVVLNIGTTEHIFSQLHAHRFIHDVTAVGGVVFHQTPAIGWANHGYFTFHPQFYRDLIAANEYERLDLFYTACGIAELKDQSIPERPPIEPLVTDAEPRGGGVVESMNLNVLTRKTKSAPFRIELEIATSHAKLAVETGSSYAAGNVTANLLQSEIPHIPTDRLVAELSRRSGADMTEPFEAWLAKHATPRMSEHARIEIAKALSSRILFGLLRRRIMSN